MSIEKKQMKNPKSLSKMLSQIIQKVSLHKKNTAVDTGKEQQVVKAFLPFFWRASLKIYVNLSSIALFNQFF